ncbi:uncharacterized protein LOC117405720 [Acipenser ruthenus]|uniref:uncharacterized protein LOC117405720 n=1 Tax=Acipenser ruthenus TaxID=7906 RepID=UPI00274259F1|nr:uncharacterized protein LOC117405720 [Acipenser ruthenus]
MLTCRVQDLRGVRVGKHITPLHCVLLFLLLCNAPTGETGFLGGSRVVFPGGCSAPLGLSKGTQVPVLSNLTVCLDIRLTAPGPWEAFTYKTLKATNYDLGIVGSDGLITVWLLGQSFNVSQSLPVMTWNTLCLEWNGRDNRLLLRVNGSQFQKNITGDTIPENGTLLLGCSGNSTAAGLGEMYLFRLWDTSSGHPASPCENGNVIGWDDRQWSFNRSTLIPDPSLQCSETGFLGGSKVVFPGGCSAPWGLSKGTQVPVLSNLTVCLDIRLTAPGPWEAFTYKTLKATNYDLGIVGSDGLIIVWLLGQSFNVSQSLPVMTWNTLCLEWNGRDNRLLLRVNGSQFQKNITGDTIPENGTLLLGCSGNSTAAGLGEMYLFRLWDTSSGHPASPCENGNVIGWDDRQWSFNRSTLIPDPSLQCTAPANAAGTSGPLNVTEFSESTTTATVSTTASRPNATDGTCDFSKFCVESDDFYMVRAEVTSNASNKTESDVKVWLTDKFNISSNSTCLTTVSSNDTVKDSKSALGDPANCSASLEYILKAIAVTCETKENISMTNCSIALQLKKGTNACLIWYLLTNPENHTLQLTSTGKLFQAARCYCPQNDEHTTTFSWFPMAHNLSSVCAANSSLSMACKNGETIWIPLNETSVQYYFDQKNIPGNTTETKKQCDFSEFCREKSAYYMIRIQILPETRNVKESDVKNWFYQVLNNSECIEMGLDNSTKGTCTRIPKIFKIEGVGVYCAEKDSVNNCTVILKISRVWEGCFIPILNQIDDINPQLNYIDKVLRVAWYGVPSGADPLQASQFIWVPDPVTSTAVCAANNKLNLTCNNNTTIWVPLKESDVNCGDGNGTTVEPSGTTVSSGTTVLNPSSTPNPPTTAPVNNTVGEASALLNITENMANLSSADIENLMNKLDALLNGPVDTKLAGIVVNVVSNVLNAPAETVASSSKKVIQVVDKVGLNLVFDTESVNITSPALSLAVKKVNGSHFEESSFSIADTSNFQITPRSPNSSSSVGAITLPASLMSNLSLDNQALASRVQFSFYEKSTVFVDKSNPNRLLNSYVIGASVSNLSIVNLQQSVIITLKNTRPVQENSTAVCVFWDSTINQGKGGWNEKGCTVLKNTTNETVCGCNHLTSFAVLMDLSRSNQTDPEQLRILTFITYIGCGISAIFLSVTLVTYLSFEKIRKDYPSKILIQLCTALLFLNLVFLIDSWIALYKDVPGLCVAVAVFLHYFLLASFTWMGLEAFHMYLALVKVFNTYVRKYMLKFCIVGWGVPAVVVAIVIAISRENYGLSSYGKYPDNSLDEFCWIKSNIAFYVSVVGYFSVIFLLNMGMFIVVLVQLCRIKNQKHHTSQRGSSFRDIKSVAGLTFLLGITWGFAFFAWGDVQLAFMYLFAIFNTLQGFFIFVFHCAAKENVRKQWRMYLCCGKLRLAENSDWSRTATNTKKRSVMPVTSFCSGSSSSLHSNITSSGSKTFLVSNEHTAPVTGNGNHYRERERVSLNTPNGDVMLNEISHDRYKLSLKEENDYETASLSLRKTLKKRGDMTSSEVQ